MKNTFLLFPRRSLCKGARMVMGKKGAGTGHPSLMPPTHPSLASTSHWPEPTPGSQQGRGAQGEAACRADPSAG